MDARRRAEAFVAVERVTALPMLVLSLALLPLVIVPMVVTLPAAIRPAWLLLEWLIWAGFAAELTVKTYLSPKRLRYLREHWFDVLVVVVPLLRPLRVLQSARALRLLRLIRLTAVVAKTTDAAGAVLRRHGLQYTLLLTVAVCVAAAALMAHVERNSESAIDGFGTALWWAVTTITTVGYGDTFPVTPEGRGIAAFLMFVGITVFGLLTANVAAFLVESQQKEDGATLADVMAKLESLEAQLAELRDQRGVPSANGTAPTNGAVHAEEPRPEQVRS